MVDTVETQCISICQNVGIELFSGDAKTVQSSIRRLLQREEQKERRKRNHELEKEKKKEKGQETRRKSLESNDTGYASDSR